ncbi:MAG TPA: HAD family phosphatase [Phycisphaerae bacterium]|nr:HAD family phosphatase [Phycisphaerae bacterium]
MPASCVIFDFDGVIADTESLHLAAYNRTLARHAADIGGPLEIPRPAYFGKYIVFGDTEAFFHMLRDHGRPTDPALIDRLAAAKHALFENSLTSGHPFEPLPGVRDTLAFLESHNVPRAICSGARRGEIIDLLDAFQLRHHFDVLVSIEDVRRGKPDPEGYNLAFDKLNLEYDAELEKEKSLVIEDSAGGCAAAQAAGLRVLAVATSLPLEEVRRCATFALPDLSHLTPAQLAEWLHVHA